MHPTTRAPHRGAGKAHRRPIATTSCHAVSSFTVPGLHPAGVARHPRHRAGTLAVRCRGSQGVNRRASQIVRPHASRTCTPTDGFPQRGRRSGLPACGRPGLVSCARSIEAARDGRRRCRAARRRPRAVTTSSRSTVGPSRGARGAATWPRLLSGAALPSSWAAKRQERSDGAAFSAIGHAGISLAVLPADGKDCGRGGGCEALDLSCPRGLWSPASHDVDSSSREESAS
jgi:hypothetical protein